MKTILIVDDEKNLLKLYEKEFSEEGYQVITASSGMEALQKLEQYFVDLVILDVPPMIINSAYSSYKDNFLTWAAEAYVVKSSDLTELKTRTRTVLEKAPRCYEAG
jgi:DNA-binding response OmpR family regulator